MVLRMLVALPALAAALFAQQSAEQTTTWTLDVNGHRADAARYQVTESPAGGERIEKQQSINGRMVPIQAVEDRVVSQNPKVVDRIIRKYDATGNPGPPMKVRIEETKNADGSTTIRSTAYDVDLNGNQQLFQRSTTQIRKSGGTTETTTNVERATANGLAMVERTQSVERPTPAGSQLESTTYRRDLSGNLTPVAQDTKQVAKKGSEESDDTAHYELGPD